MNTKQEITDEAKQAIHMANGEMSDKTVAALYVQKNGAYYGIPDVDPWGEERDARLYAGPHPVVAHPPCSRWCRLAHSVEARLGEKYKVGEDGGCFAAALRSVKQWGGVLEHPAASKAFYAYDLTIPKGSGWIGRLGEPGWSCEVSQAAYGHRTRKLTWLYYYSPKAVPPFALDWSRPQHTAVVGHDTKRGSNYPRLTARENLATPVAFRDALISLARSSR